jgi:hypothetical protein
MPAFSAIAAYLVTAIVGIEGAAILGAAGVSFLTSVVAVGIAAVTSRIINGPASSNRGQDQGVRITLPPATNNKIPVIYGSVFQQGIITDARISNENKTMSYVLVLSEKTQTGNYTIGDIFWNDQKLAFGTGNNSHKVVSSEDPNGDTNDKLKDRVRMRVYAGGTGAGRQIFPVVTGGNTLDARSLLDETDSNYLLTDLVFAVVQIDYSPDNGITGLPPITFQVNNSLKNPGLVWYDYMTASYGANLPAEYVDSVSSTGTGPTSLFTHSNDQTGLTQFQADGVTPLNQARYEINGILNTGDVVKSNLEKINTASASFTTYDIASGKWKVLCNRAATVGEKASAFTFNDDNIVSEITVSATPYEDAYNQLEVEFASRTQRDQTDYYKDELLPAQRNEGEPDNSLRLKVEMINNAVHAARLGLIELRQSRVDLVVSFTADYSAIQCQAGDIVKITNAVYGFEDDIFRVTRVREVEGEDGTLVAEITALEYSDEVYEEAPLSDFADKPISDIPLFGSTASLKKPAAPTFQNANNIAAVPYFDIRTIIPANNVPVDVIDIFYSNTLNGEYVFYASMKPLNTVYAANDVVNMRVSGVPKATYYVKARLGSRGSYSPISDASSVLDWDPQATAAIVGSNFDLAFRPASLAIPKSINGTPNFTGIVTKLYAQSGGEDVDFIDADSDTALSNNQWRIGASSATGYSDIVLNNITIDKHPTEVLQYAQWAIPSAMTAEPATMTVPVRYKNSSGDIKQATAPAVIQYVFQTQGPLGPQGNQGPQGPQGPQGDRGTDGTGVTTPRTVTGYIYYTLSANSAPFKPAPTNFNFTNGLFGFMTANWDQNFTQPAPSGGGAVEKYWAVRYTVSEITYGGSQNVYISDPFNWINFNGLVTFNNLATNQGTTFIDGGNIITKTITADAITATNLSSITANLGNVTAGNITIGSNPALLGTNMTGSGAKIMTDGKFALGNAGTNITFNGSQLTLNGEVVATGNISNNGVTIRKLAPGASLPDYVRTFKGEYSPEVLVPLNNWAPLQMDTTALNNEVGAIDYDNYRTLLPAGTYFYELSVPVKCQGSDTNDACYTAIVDNPLGAASSGHNETYYDENGNPYEVFVPDPYNYNIIDTAGVNVVGDWQTATIFGVGRFTLATSKYISAAVKTTDTNGPNLNIVSRSGYSTAILRIWRDYV